MIPNRNRFFKLVRFIASSFGILTDSHSSLADARRDLGPHEDAIIAHVKQPIEESHTAGLRPLHSDSTKMPNNDVTTLIIEQNTCYAEDTSQISAPDGKSKLTPTSQIGFQDPASAGGSQQLTIFSIEVFISETLCKNFNIIVYI